MKFPRSGGDLVPGNPSMRWRCEVLEPQLRDLADAQVVRVTIGEAAGDLVPLASVDLVLPSPTKADKQRAESLPAAIPKP
jgi:hypothetical protein